MIYLVDTGFDPKNGARPLQRVIDKEIKRPLSRQILFGDLKDGGKVAVDFKDGELVLDCVKEHAVETSLSHVNCSIRSTFINWYSEMNLSTIFRSDFQKKEKLSYARHELDRLA